MACFGDFVRLISSASGLNGALTPIEPIKCQRERKTPQNRIENQQPLMSIIEVQTIEF